MNGTLRRWLSKERTVRVGPTDRLQVNQFGR